MPEPFKKITLDFAAKSDIGLVRTENQDSHGKFPEDNTDIYSSSGQLFIVADGMGGHAGGKEASSIAVKVVKNEYFNSSQEESIAIKEAIEKANDAIYKQSGDRSEIGRMGTTCSVLLLKAEKGIIGHVGDSRIYKIENNHIEQLTNDHTKVQEMLREGILTPDEAKNYPSKSVLARALGVDEKVRIDIIDDIELNQGQSYVLCSDGLAKVSKEEILEIVSGNTPADACDMLVDLANERGGKDNVTVIIVNIESDRQAEIPQEQPVKKKKIITRSKSEGKKSRRWLGVFIFLLVIIILLVIRFKDSILPNSKGENSKDSVANLLKEKISPDESENKLLEKADRFLKNNDFEKAYVIYKSILDKQPMHQAALKGIGEIATIYISLGDRLMNIKNFEEALQYYEKAGEIQPGNEKIKSLIRLCKNQIDYKKSNTDTSGKENNSVVISGTDSGSIATKFDLPGWNYPGVNKNEFSISSNELSFTNTLSEKFIIYNKDLNDVTISVKTEIDRRNSVLGLIIGYVSPFDYFIFKYRDGGNYTLQRIKGNNTESLLVIRPKDQGESSDRKMKIIYSDNLISIYDQNGLISSYRSEMQISGKAGIYIDRNSSAKFQNIFLSGRTKSY